MISKKTILFVLTILAFQIGFSQSGKHLFILSGQSNMERLDPEISFIPEVKKAFGEENTIVVKNAIGV